MNTLKYVVLGAGGIANFHVHHFEQQPNVKVVGFQDIAQGQLDKWKSRYPDAVYCTDPNELLAKTRPDFACVCSANIAHASLALAALKAGAHVMCEKPMAMNVAEAEAMEKARAAGGLVGAINFSYRCVGAFRFAREMVRSGELGRIQRMNVVYLQSFIGPETIPWSWRNDAKIAGFGALGDLGVHMIDGASFVSSLRPVRAVGLAQTLVNEKRDSAGKPQPVTTDTNASFLVEYDNGALGTFETSQVVPGYGNHFRIEISGERGVLRICSEDNDGVVMFVGGALSKYLTWAREQFPRIPVPTGFIDHQPKSNMECFVRALRGEDVEYPSFADGLSAQKVLNGIVDSMKTRAWVEF
jgi:predicted dehydrogenase